MPLRGRHRAAMAVSGIVMAALGMVLLAGLATLSPRRQNRTILETKGMSDEAWQAHLQRVRDRQQQFERDDAKLEKTLHSRDRSVRAMLGGDEFTPAAKLSAAQLARAEAAARKRKQLKAQRAAERKQAKEEKEAMLDLAAVQQRRKALLKVALAQLSEDKERVVLDVVGGSAKQVAQDRRRVIGDERLAALLEGSELAAEMTGAGEAGASGEGGGDAGEAAKRRAAKIVRGHREVADVLHDNEGPLQRAGVKTNKDFTPWLMGMHEPMTAHDRFFEGHKYKDGEKKLLKAGVAVDRLPGFGEDYRRALPLPAFHDHLPWERVQRSLEAGHRPLSSGFEKMHRAGVNVNAPNMFVYGSEERGTPRSDQSTTAFHYADGLEDSVTAAAAARKHQPLSFVLHDLRRGSEPLERGGVNVWGSDLLKDLDPAQVESWENQVPAEEIHHPLVDGEDAAEEGGKLQ